MHVHPSARKNEVLGYVNGLLEIKISAPPERGRANKELIDFLSERLAVSKSKIAIVKGQTSRHKLLSIDGLTQEELEQRLAP